MTENKLVRKFLAVCKAYIREMNEKVSYDKTNIEARAANALYGVYLDYSALRHKYTRDDARTAMAVFSKYADQAITVLSELKKEYPELNWQIGKTDMSSALIGRALFISSSENNIDEIFPEFEYGNGGYFVNITENLKDNTMKLNENTKVTLTVGQLRKLVMESWNEDDPYIDKFASKLADSVRETLKNIRDLKEPENALTNANDFMFKLINAIHEFNASALPRSLVDAEREVIANVFDKAK